MASAASAMSLVSRSRLLFLRQARCAGVSGAPSTLAPRVVTLPARSLHSTTSRPERESGGWTYRSDTWYNESDRKFLDFWSTAVGTMLWWWILWHVFTDYEHMIGTPLPDPSKWTDKELGIPSDLE